MNGSPFASECPKCGQRAPIVLRGLESRCAACGAARFLLAAPNMTLAGQPSRWGGIAVTIAGTAVLLLGLSLAVGVWFLFQAFSATTALSWAFSIPTAVASLFFGLLLLFGGSRLRQSGAEREQRVKRDAVRSFVQHRRGPISALEASRALELPEAEVDTLMTELARERATAVTVDVDPQGHVVYDFEGEEKRWRVLEEDVAAAEAEAADPGRSRAGR